MSKKTTILNEFDRKMFGKKINRIRKEQKITSEVLSVMCEVNAVFIRQIESGNRLPSLSVLIKICTALHTSPGYLLGLEFENDGNDSILKTFFDERINNELELSLRANKRYQNVTQVANQKHNKLNCILNEKQRIAVDRVISAYNYASDEYGHAAYRQGFQDCLKLKSELCQ